MATPSFLQSSPYQAYLKREIMMPIVLKSVQSGVERKVKWDVHTGRLYNTIVPAWSQAGKVLKRRLHVFLIQVSPDSIPELWLRVR